MHSAVITGRGNFFCTAAKFDDVLRVSHPLALHKRTTLGFQLMFDAFISFPKPILAAVNGPAYGGGVTQATLCDVTFSVEQAIFSLPFVKWHVSPEGCSTAHLARIIG